MISINIQETLLFRFYHGFYYLHHYICSTDSVPHEKTFRVGLFHTKLSQRHNSMEFLANDFALTLLNYFFSSFPDICQFQSTTSDFRIHQEHTDIAICLLTIWLNLVRRGFYTPEKCHWWLILCIRALKYDRLGVCTPKNQIKIFWATLELKK